MSSPTDNEILITHVSDFRNLVSTETYRRLRNRIQKDKGYSQAHSELCIDSAIGFLYLCATNNGPFVPSRFVDDGWHTFLLYTQEYFEFCNRIAGRYIHHSPNDRAKSSSANIDSEYRVGKVPSYGIKHTIDAMVQSNIPIDLNAWLDHTNLVDSDCDDRACERQESCKADCDTACTTEEEPEDSSNIATVRVSASLQTRQQKQLIAVAAANTTCDCDSGNGPDFNCTCC